MTTLLPPFSGAFYLSLAFVCMGASFWILLVNYDKEKDAGKPILPLWLLLAAILWTCVVSLRWLFVAW